MTAEDFSILFNSVSPSNLQIFSLAILNSYIIEPNVALQNWISKTASTPHGIVTYHPLVMDRKLQPKAVLPPYWNNTAYWLSFSLSDIGREFQGGAASKTAY